MDTEAGGVAEQSAAPSPGATGALRSSEFGMPSLKHSSPHFNVFGHELEVGHGSGLGSVPRELVATRDLKKMGFVEQSRSGSGGESAAPVQWGGNPRFRTKADLLRSRRKEKVRVSRSNVNVKKQREAPFSFAPAVDPPRPSSRSAKRAQRAPYYTKEGEEALPQRDGSVPAPRTKKDLLRTRAQTMHDNLEAGKARYDEIARTLRMKHSNLPPRPLRNQGNAGEVGSVFILTQLGTMACSASLRFASLLCPETTLVLSPVSLYRVAFTYQYLPSCRTAPLSLDKDFRAYPDTAASPPL